MIRSVFFYHNPEDFLLNSVFKSHFFINLLKPSIWICLFSNVLLSSSIFQRVRS